MTTFCDRCGAPVGAGDQRCRTCGWPVPVPLTPAERGEIAPPSATDAPGTGGVVGHDDDPTPLATRPVPPAEVSPEPTQQLDPLPDGPGVDDPADYGRWRLRSDPELAQWREEPDPADPPVRPTFGVVDDEPTSGTTIAVRMLAGFAAAVVVVLVGLAVLFFGVLRPSGDKAPVGAASTPATVPVSTPPPGADSTSASPPPSTAPTTASPTTTAYPPVRLPGSACGGSGAGPWSRVASGTSSTSCPFAIEVQKAYLASAPQPDQPRTVSATSPVTGKAYPMTCTGNQPVTCTGGNGAVVYLYGGPATFR